MPPAHVAAARNIRSVVGHTSSNVYYSVPFLKDGNRLGPCKQDRQRHGALLQKSAQVCLKLWNSSLTLNFSKAKLQKAAVEDKVDLPAFPDIAKRPRGR
jgi:hypothetical protein